MAKDSQEKRYGAGVFVTGNHIVDSYSEVLPVSPVIDPILGGGIPEGSTVILTGPPKVGKTSLALDFAATCQLRPYTENVDGTPYRKVFFYNIEGRVKPRDLMGIHHLKPEQINVIQSEKGNILTAEKYIAIAEENINEFPGAIHIIDSFSQLCTEGEMTAEIGDRYRPDAPLLLARFCRRISNVVPINKCIVIGITHMIANQGMGMSPWTEASGRKLQYQVDVKLKASHSKAIDVGDSQVGQEVFWECLTTALNKSPGSKATSRFRYGYGIDKPAELAELAVSLGLITKSGAWFKFDDGQQFQGLEKLRNAIDDNPELYERYNKLTREMLGFDELDKKPEPVVIVTTKKSKKVKEDATNES